MQPVQVVRSGRFDGAARVVAEAVEAKAFPAAVVEVGDATRPVWREAFGRLTYDADARPAAEDTVFDLASLTKVLATVPIAMQQVERGAIGLDDLVRDHVAGWTNPDRAQVTVRDLLAHSSGLAGHAPLYESCRTRAEFEDAICRSPLAHPPRTKSIYSDLGFMLLGFLLERGGTLAARFDVLRAQMAVVEDLQFHPPRPWLPRIAPTEFDRWRGHLLVGEVHDENAWALGGAAAHAGLFGTAAAVGQCARHWLQVLDGRTGAFTRATAETFIRRADVPDGSRALGWDTMRPTSSCGRRMSPRAFGHTGFTGTSLWIDPDRAVYVVLLTNRIHPSRDNEAIRQVRPTFHDAVMEALDISD
ncbi:MAG: beta-lactamase family protein [Acidobacteria bacterium]|nr:beta-lactamase family protein [Acidobacteriota bacterium]